MNKEIPEEILREMESAGVESLQEYIDYICEYGKGWAYDDGYADGYKEALRKILSTFTNAI